MVRGGRSWPPEWKAGRGAVSAGNVTEDVRPGCSRDRTAPTMEAMQQPLAQKWQVAGCPPEDESSSDASAFACWCAAEWSACISSPARMLWCACTVTSWVVLVPSPSGHSMLAATAPRMGSSRANRTKMKMRRRFTVAALSGRRSECAEQWNFHERCVPSSLNAIAANTVLRFRPLTQRLHKSKTPPRGQGGPRIAVQPPSGIPWRACKTPCS